MSRTIKGTIATQLPKGYYFAGYANAEEKGYSDSSKHLKNFKESIRKSHHIKEINHNGPHQDRSTSIKNFFK